MTKREKINRTYSSSIGSTLQIHYSVVQEDNEPAASIQAVVLDKDKRVGTANFERQGALGITLAQGLAPEEREAVLLDMVRSSEEIFKES